MTVLITLTTAGTDSGPFDLYSNLDGYVSAFATGVSKAALLAGYSSASVPDNTTIIRVKSNGDCINYIDITLTSLTTTTTTTVFCNCFQIEANISQVDLDDATGNTDPINDNLINLFFLDCDGIFSNYIYTVAGINYSVDVCTNDPASILNFRYMKNDVLITDVVSTASLSSICCSTTTTTTTVLPTTTTTTTLAPAPEDFTYYQAEYNPCIAEACSGSPTALWFYNLVPSLIVDKYYYDGVGDRAYHIIDGPFTYAEYVTAGSPLAIETNAGFASIMYNTCTCLPIAPE